MQSSVAASTEWVGCCPGPAPLLFPAFFQWEMKLGGKKGRNGFCKLGRRSFGCPGASRARANGVFAELQTRCCQPPSSRRSHPAVNMGEISSGSTPALDTDRQPTLDTDRQPTPTCSEHLTRGWCLQHLAQGQPQCLSCVELPPNHPNSRAND